MFIIKYYYFKKIGKNKIKLISVFKKKWDKKLKKG